MEKGHLIEVLDKGFVRLVDWMGTDSTILEAARVSYLSESKGPVDDEKLLNYLWSHMHTSPFEMVKIKFQVKMPIFVARQYIRHRMQNVNETSMRYTEPDDDFYFPTGWRKQDTKNKQGSLDVGDDWNPELYTFEPHETDGIKHRVRVTATDALKAHCQTCFDLYENLLKVGIARELARMVLPLNIYTQMYVCWDLKNLLHFVRLRDDLHAQKEIQAFGKAIKSILVELFPWTMAAFERYQMQCVDVVKQAEEKQELLSLRAEVANLRRHLSNYTPTLPL